MKPAIARKKINAKLKREAKRPSSGVPPPSGMINFRPSAAEAKPQALALPTADPQTVQLSETGPGLLNKAKAIVISDEKTCTAASEGLVVIKDALTKLEERRKFFVKPLKDHARNIDQFFARLSEPVEQADQILRAKVLAYRDALAKTAEEERSKLVEQAVEAHESGDTVTSAALATQAETIAAPAKRLDAGGLGTVGTSKVWKFEVTNEREVPREYLIVNETAIRRAVSSGLREIPGVRIFQSEQLKVGGLDL